MAIDVKELSQVAKLDASGVYYRDLNQKLRELVLNGTNHIELENVCGQRYIGTNLNRPATIDISGTPGNDLGAFMNGPTITVHGNVQDGCGNTMNEGTIVVHGRAGDILGLSARGGRIFVRDDVGYRAGIHMKEYREKKPVIVVGGTAQDFCGEYMAGGVLILLGLTLGENENHKASFVGTGMHGGAIYIRGNINDYQLGKELGAAELNEQDMLSLKRYISEFASYFNYSPDDILRGKFTKYFPRYLRPYGTLYAY